MLDSDPGADVEQLQSGGLSKHRDRKHGGGSLPVRSLSQCKDEERKGSRKERTHERFQVPIGLPQLGQKQTHSDQCER